MHQFATKQYKNLYLLFLRSSKYTIMVLMPLVGLLMVFSPMLIDVLFGNNYTDVILSFKILSLAIPFLATFSYLSTLFAGVGKTKEVLLLNLSATGITIILSFLFVSQFGLPGAALAIMTTHMLKIVLGYVFLVKNVVKELARTVLHFLPMYLLCFILLVVLMLMTIYLDLSIALVFVLISISLFELCFFKWFLNQEEQNAFTQALKLQFLPI
jgi:O-antigen/teichoic acid export membrane protein